MISQGGLLPPREVTETSELFFFFFVDSLLFKEVPRPKGCDVEFKPPSCPAGGFAKPPKDCWALKCFLHPLNRARQCPSPHPREDRNGERQGKRVSICGLWIFWDILKCPKGTHIHRADLNIPGNAPGWKPGVGGMLGPCMAALCHRQEQLPIQALQCLTQRRAHRKGI